jgi:pimeloyl-ACP methyl ester carboxylesterase
MSGSALGLREAGLIALSAVISRVTATVIARRQQRGTDNPSGELSYTQLADDMAALIDLLALDRPIVGGYSDGGQVTLEFGARHPGVAAD